MTFSTLSKSFAVAAALAATAAGSALAGEFSSAKVVRPLAGLSFDVGSKHAAGYFVQKNGGCDLTLVVGDNARESSEGARGTVPARFTTPIAAGRTARIDTGEGPSVELFCSSGAAWLSSRVMERVAYGGASTTVK